MPIFDKNGLIFAQFCLICSTVLQKETELIQSDWKIWRSKGFGGLEEGQSEQKRCTSKKAASSGSGEYYCNIFKYIKYIILEHIEMQMDYFGTNDDENK